MNKLKQIFIVSILLLLVSSCNKQTRVPIETHFWAPNSFSPNNSASNQLFYVVPVFGVYIGEFHLSIYNQDLKLFFETNNISDGWNGKVGTVDAPEGYYDYQILYSASTDSVTYEDYITSSKLNLFR